MAQYQSSAGPIPRGNAFLVQTPETDRVSDELFRQQQERELYSQRESMQMDKEMAKEFGAIRNTDTPEVIANYGKYKNLMKDVYFDQKLQRDPLKLAQAKQQANSALADVYGTIQASKEKKVMADDLLKVHAAHPERFQDNFGDLYKAMMNTPASKLNAVNVGGKTYDLSNPDTFFDYSPTADLGTMLKTAMGTPQERFHSDTPVGTKGLQVMRTPSLYGSSPAQIVESLKNQYKKGNAEKTATAMFRALPPETVAATEQEYNSIPADRWEKMTGSQLPQKLSFDDEPSDAGKYAVYQGMKAAINNLPSEGKPQVIDVKENIMNEAQKQKLEIQKNNFLHQDWMQKITQGNINQRQQNTRNWQLLDDESKTASIPAGFTAQMQTAMKDASPVIVPKDKGVLTGYEFDPITVVKKQLAYKDEKGHYQDPDKFLIRQDDDGVPLITGLFYERDDKGNLTNKVDETKTTQFRGDDPQLIGAVRKDLDGVPKTKAGVAATTPAASTPKAGEPIMKEGKPVLAIKQHGQVYHWNPNKKTYE